MLIIGKLLLAVCLCTQSFLLLTDNKQIESFEKNAVQWTKAWTQQQGHLVKDNLRFAAAGLMGVSALTVLFKTAFFKVLVLLGLAITFGVDLNLKKNGIVLTNQDMWEKLAFLGIYVFLLGADGATSESQEVKSPSKKANSEGASKRKPQLNDKKIRQQKKRA